MALLNKVKTIISQFQGKTDYIENSINNLGKSIDKNVNKISNYFNQQPTIENIKSNPDLALKLFQTLSVGYSMSQKEQRQINNILKTCNCRQDILNKVIELCGNPTTAKQRYIYAMAYSWSVKEYRSQAIHYLEYYLSNPVWDGAYQGIFRYYQQPLEERKKEHISSMYKSLAEVYEKEYAFDKALINYENALKFEPYNPLLYSGKVQILIKQDNINEAIQFLRQVQKSPYYCRYEHYTPTDWFIKTIDKNLLDCYSKKEQNYHYKPRPRKKND